MQTFNIEVEGMQVTAHLVRGLLRQYFNDVQYGGNIVVEEAAQHNVQRTVAQPCERHNMELCSECYPVVVVDFNRR